MSKQKKKKRFKTYYKQSDNDGTEYRILEDTETGLSYLYVSGEKGVGGLTILLDEEGDPAVVPDFY